MADAVGVDPIVSISLILCCLCATMLRSLVCVKEQSMLRRLFAMFFCRGEGQTSSCRASCSGNGGADLGEGGGELVYGVDEGGAGVFDGDADELNSAPIPAKGGV